MTKWTYAELADLREDIEKATRNKRPYKTYNDGRKSGYRSIKFLGFELKDYKRLSKKLSDKGWDTYVRENNFNQGDTPARLYVF